MNTIRHENSLKSVKYALLSARPVIKYTCNCLSRPVFDAESTGAPLFDLAMAIPENASDKVTKKLETRFQELCDEWIEQHGTLILRYLRKSKTKNRPKRIPVVKNRYKFMHKNGDAIRIFDMLPVSDKLYKIPTTCNKSLAELHFDDYYGDILD